MRTLILGFVGIFKGFVQGLFFLVSVFLIGFSVGCLLGMSNSPVLATFLSLMLPALVVLFKQSLVKDESKGILKLLLLSNSVYFSSVLYGSLIGIQLRHVSNGWPENGVLQLNPVSFDFSEHNLDVVEAKLPDTFNIARVTRVTYEFSVPEPVETHETIQSAEKDDKTQRISERTSLGSSKASRQSTDSRSGGLNAVDLPFNLDSMNCVDVCNHYLLKLSIVGAEGLDKRIKERAKECSCN